MRWRVGMAAPAFRVEAARAGKPQELRLTRQRVAVPEGRRAAAGGMPERARPWAFASETGSSGQIHNPQHLYAPTALAGGPGFRFRATRSCFIGVARRDLTLSGSPAGRPVNRARPCDPTEGCTADRAVERCRIHARRIAGRIDEPMHTNPDGAVEPGAPVRDSGGP